MMHEIQRGDRALTTNLQELHTLAETHLTNSKAANTKKAYGTDWRLFVQWCRDHSLESLPASEETVVYYLTFLSQTSKASTIKRKMTAISQRHETANYASPTKTPLVQGVWNGIQRTIGVKEVGKDALWLHDLRRLVHVLPPSRIGTRDHARSSSSAGQAPSVGVSWWR